MISGVILTRIIWKSTYEYMEQTFHVDGSSIFFYFIYLTPSSYLTPTPKVKKLNLHPLPLFKSPFLLNVNLNVPKFTILYFRTRS